MADEVDDQAAALYRADRKRFVRARDQLAKQLRADGDRTAAKEVKALRKPTKATWALNVVAAENSTRELPVPGRNGVENARRAELDLGCAGPRQKLGRESQTPPARWGDWIVPCVDTTGPAERAEEQSMADNMVAAERWPTVAGMGARRRSLGRLAPSVVDAPVAGPGVHEVDVGTAQPSWLSVPAVDHPVPLLVFLHGAGADGRQALDLMGPVAAEHGIGVLAPSAAGTTWDLLEGGFGPDVEAIERGLGAALSRVSIDRGRMAIGGFSDGASYALSLGIPNGDLFSSILAFSPGFASPPSSRDDPAIFVAHGTEDPVLPIQATSRRLVPALRRAGYRVEYHEFEGGHGVAPHLAATSVRLLHR